MYQTLIGSDETKQTPLLRGLFLGCLRKRLLSEYGVGFMLHQNLPGA